MMKRVLIVDDRPSGVEFVEAVLKSAACEVLAASNGEAAVAMARQYQPDLVLLDLRMPGLDGFGVVERLRSDGRHDGLIVVALTASGMSGDRERALQNGFDGYLVKPIGVAELRKQVTYWLSKERNPPCAPERTANQEEEPLWKPNFETFPILERSEGNY